MTRSSESSERYFCELISRLRPVGLLVAGRALASALHAQAPRVSSVSPSDGTTGVPAATPIGIQFDRDMDTRIPIFATLGNLKISPSSLGAQTQGIWGEDRRTLTLQRANRIGTFQWSEAGSAAMDASGAGSFEDGESLGRVRDLAGLCRNCPRPPTIALTAARWCAPTARSCPGCWATRR